MAKFSRASTAYDDSGSVVAANTPRMSSKGLLIEQEFNNLALNGDFRDGTSKWQFVYNSTISSFNLHGGQSVKFVAENKNPYVQQYIATTANNKFYVSAYCYIDEWTSSLDIPFLDIRNSSKIITTFYPDITKTKQWQIVSGIFTNDLSATILYIGTANAIRTGTFYATDIRLIDLTAMFGAGNEPTAAVCDLLFNKPIYGDKKSDTLTIPGTAINAEQGTIEFDCIMEQPSSIKPSGVHWGLFSGVGGLFSVHQPNGAANTLKFSRGTWPGSISRTVYWRAGDKLHIRARWNGTNIYFDATNKTTNVSVSGTNNNSVSTTITSLNFSNAGGVAQPINAYYSNLRISNVCRPDAELANTGALAVDEFTTYFLPMNGNLGAQGQGVSVSSGNGATKQLRTGAGYRSVTAKAAVKSYILRTAKFYPQIIASADGKTTQSRVGSGYRTAVIQSSADVKLIEPGIEISTAVIERKGVTSVIERLSRTEVIGVPYIGDTVTLRAEFYTKGGVLADPVNISLKFFDSLKNQIGTTITIGSQHRISAGVYQYDYTVPSGYRNIFYEFAATQESTPQLIPGRIACKQRVDVGNWE